MRWIAWLNQPEKPAGQSGKVVHLKKPISQPDLRRDGSARFNPMPTPSPSINPKR
jgi:hypothetical protein